VTAPNTRFNFLYSSLKKRIRYFWASLSSPLFYFYCKKRLTNMVQSSIVVPSTISSASASSSPATNNNSRKRSIDSSNKNDTQDEEVIPQKFSSHSNLTLCFSSYIRSKDLVQKIMKQARIVIEDYLVLY
jgi:hypothetical protein